MQVKKEKVHYTKEPVFKIDFKACLDCASCADKCSFLQNNVIFVFYYKRKQISELRFDTSHAICKGKCDKVCTNPVMLVEILKKQHINPNNILQ